MKEVKPPKKPLIYYYGVALVVLLLINFLLVPLVARHAVQEVDYGTFMTMTENKEIGQVEVEDNQIIFTNKDTIIRLLEKWQRSKQRDMER